MRVPQEHNTDTTARGGEIIRYFRTPRTVFNCTVVRGGGGGEGGGEGGRGTSLQLHSRHMRTNSSAGPQGSPQLPVVRAVRNEEWDRLGQ